MTLYTDLQADIVETLSDTEVDEARARYFIERAEPKLQRDLLSVLYGGSVPRQMLARVEGTTATDATFPLPDDFQQARFVRVGQGAMRYAAPSQVPSGVEGRGEQTIVLDYYQKLPVLVQNLNESNWLLVDGYDAYLWAACVQYALWGQEPEVQSVYNVAYQDALRSVKEVHGRKQRGALRADRDVQYTGRYTIIGETMRFA